MMREKLGLFNEENNDETLITGLLSWMEKNKADYTNTFLFLMKEKLSKVELFQDSTFFNWHQQWQERLKQNNKPLESILERIENGSSHIFISLGIIDIVKYNWSCNRKRLFC